MSSWSFPFRGWWRTPAQCGLGRLPVIGLGLTGAGYLLAVPTSAHSLVLGTWWEITIVTPRETSIDWWTEPDAGPYMLVAWAGVSVAAARSPEWAAAWAAAGPRPWAAIWPLVPSRIRCEWPHWVPGVLRKIPQE